MSGYNGAEKKLAVWRSDPAKFVRDVFQAEPDPWQINVLKAFADPKQQRIAMKAAKGCGKSSLLAWCIWNFLVTRPHTKVAATSITSDNLADGLWTELAKWMSKSELLRAHFTWTKTRIFANDFPETWWVSARSWPRTADTTQQADTLAGLHADYLLFVLDEAGGIPDAVTVAAEAGLATGIETKIIMAGNPTNLSGPIYRAATSERHLWFLQEITGDPDNPNRSQRISIQWAREQIEKYGRDNPWVMVNVFGQFPPSALNALLGPDDVQAAMERNYAEDVYNTAAKIIGVDPARFGDDRCFDDKTEILTDEGWKLFSDLHGRERVFSLDGDKAVWGSIMHIHKAPFDGELNVCESRHINFAVTDNHRMLVRTGPKTEEYCFRPFRELPDYFVVRGWNRWSGESPCRREFVHRREMPNGGFSEWRSTYDMGDWAEFLGWFVAEGNVYIAPSRKNHRRVILTQYPGEKCSRLERLMTRMGIIWRACSNGTQIEFTNAAVGDWLREHCGIGAHNKCIPYEIKNGSESVINRFLDGFLAGDGTMRLDGTGRCYVTSSKRLADDVQEILAKVGRAGSIKRKNMRGSQGEIHGRAITRRHDTYVIYERAAPSDKWVSPRNIKRVPYCGFVWCVATPLESIYVRRQGVPMWSGNTVLFPRQGLVAFTPVVMRNARTNEIAARIAVAADKWKPDAIFIDDTGGFGAGVIDSCLQSGLTPIPVNFSGKASDPRYMNRRAEMHFKMAEAVKNGLALPKVLELTGELTAPTYVFNNGKFRIEEKDQIKSRLGRSPDLSDALALTYAQPVVPSYSFDTILHRASNRALTESDPFQ